MLLYRTRVVRLMPKELLGVRSGVKKYRFDPYCNSLKHLAMNEDNYRRWRKWHNNVFPIRDLGPFARPHYFANMTELIYLLQMDGYVISFVADRFTYDFITMKQIVYN